MPDVGVSTVMELIDQLKEEVQRRNIQDPKEVQAVISEKLIEIYKGDSDLLMKLMCKRMV
ncbi:signal recognition particle receptor subunit alpha [Bacillus pacificus]